MRTFVVIWLGQLVSMIGSGLTGFSLGLWVFQTTGSATNFALIFLSSSLPSLLVSPFAGALVDRWDRRRVMLISDAVAWLGTIAIAILFFTGRIETWHIYITSALASICSAFQYPAYSAAITMLVPKAHYGRAAGMVQMAAAVTEIVAPALAGALFFVIGVQGIILIDIGTFLFALTTLVLVRIPRPHQTAEGQAARGSLLSETIYGWRYIKDRPGLLRLLLLFAMTNFAFGMVVVLFTPFVALIGGPEKVGTVLSISGFGMLLGALLMSTWGGPKRRVNAIVVFISLQGLMCMLASLEPNLILVTSATFIYMAMAPLINGCSQAIWQSKVAPDIQGRVFAVRRMIAMSASPLAYAIAGPLADRVFEPFLAADGLLASTVGRIIGVGPGRGIAFIYTMMGLLTIVAAVSTWMSPRARHVEQELPDHIVDSEAPAA